LFLTEDRWTREPETPAPTIGKRETIPFSIPKKLGQIPDNRQQDVAGEQQVAESGTARQQVGAGVLRERRTFENEQDVLLDPLVEMEVNSMFLRELKSCAAGVALLAACVPATRAQTAPPPAAYTVTATSSMFGPPQIVKTYRLGSKVLVDQFSEANAADPNAPHSRSLFDLATHKNLSWSWPDSSGGCGAGTFSGDWGDPFAGAADLFGAGSKPVGTETLRGFTTRILEGSTGDTEIRAWVDTKYGMVVKAQLSQAGSPLKTVMEVTAVSLTPPPASVFDLPAVCAAAAAAPTEEEKLAALTGSDPKDFVDATHGPGSQSACTVLYRVVKAGSMEPLASDFQVAVDLTLATEPTPSYTEGVSQSGRATFSGGGLHEIASPTHNGVFRIDHAPAQFDLETAFGNAGDTQAIIYLQCFAPQTVLLYVVKNPAKISDGGEWLWVKSGKYAAP
jgi:hypothetical protein